MIKTDKGKTTLNGTGAEILADISCIAEAVKRAIVKVGASEEQAMDDIRKAVEDGFKPDDEVKDEIMDFLRKEFDEFCKEFMEKLNGGNKDD